MDLIDHLEGQLQILVPAAHDMAQVIAACVALEREEATGPLSEALATAIAVCYARPFSSTNAVGRLGSQWTPKVGTPEREIHDWLLEERKKRYAHTDKLQRLVLHRGELESGFDGLAEFTTPFAREHLGRIMELADSLRKQVLAEAFDVQEKIVEEALGPEAEER